ncbi:hypothetical protein GQ44DRAFT_780001 [Phaeosphaeriaceae sp. PMI808]|nr:hypothetical protein GQ44DRAFT_780001 [Phaeosphaeriaceae sp. PMI808]
MSDAAPERIKNRRTHSVLACEECRSPWEGAPSLSGEPGDENSDEEPPITSQTLLDIGDLETIALPRWPPTILALDFDRGRSGSLETLPTVPGSAYFSIPGSNGKIPGPALRFSPLDIGAGSPQKSYKKGIPNLLANSSVLQLTDLECADLDDLFFEPVYPFAPIINQSCYYALANRAASEPSEAFTCLQNAMRTLAASMARVSNNQAGLNDLIGGLAVWQFKQFNLSHSNLSVKSI